MLNRVLRRRVEQVGDAIWHLHSHDIALDNHLDASRVAGGDRQRAGTGLGLAICKGLTEAMGGTIRAETGWPDGSGTRIVVSLPLHNPEAI